MGSHPMWVRGLKLGEPCHDVCELGVAPYVGAWIETKYYDTGLDTHHVAPYVGAWIETVYRNTNVSASTCRTLCGCVD